MEALNTELDEWKRKSTTIHTGMVVTATEPASKQLGQLKQDVLNFLPSVVSFTNARNKWDPPENNGPPSLNLRPRGPTLLLLPLTLEPSA